MIGIATNFGVWIFTKYSKKDEMLKNKAPFLVSKPIELVDPRNNKIREDELR